MEDVVHIKEDLEKLREIVTSVQEEINSKNAALDKIHISQRAKTPPQII